jgi:hypothetical protein
MESWGGNRSAQPIGSHVVMMFHLVSCEEDEDFMSGVMNNSMVVVGVVTRGSEVGNIVSDSEEREQCIIGKSDFHTI